jgi:hypothetical protein
MIVTALGAAGAGMAALAAALAGIGALLGWRARRWAKLARRSRIGAISERMVRSKLAVLQRDGWRVQHSLRWPGGGDVDHIATKPGPRGITFAIETKTRSYRLADLERTRRITGWLARRRSPWRRRTVIPVLCLAGAQDVQRFESGIAVVSLERLVPLLCRLAGTAPVPPWPR